MLALGSRSEQRAAPLFGVDLLPMDIAKLNVTLQVLGREDPFQPHAVPGLGLVFKKHVYL